MTDFHETFIHDNQQTEQYYYAETLLTDRNNQNNAQDIIPEAETDHFLNGIGIFIRSDGSVYQGEWKNDLKDGYGEFEWPEGSVYKGTWKNDIMFGEGIYINKFGIEFRGLWFEFKFISKTIEAI